MFIITPFFSAYGIHSNCTIATDKEPCDLKWSSSEVHKPVAVVPKGLQLLSACLLHPKQARWKWILVMGIDQAAIFAFFFWYCSRRFASASQFNMLFFFLCLLGKYLSQCLQKVLHKAVSKIPTRSHLRSCWSLWLSNPAVFGRKGSSYRLQLNPER